MARLAAGHRTLSLMDRDGVVSASKSSRRYVAIFRENGEAGGEPTCHRLSKIWPFIWMGPHLPLASILCDWISILYLYRALFSSRVSNRMMLEGRSVNKEKKCRSVRPSHDGALLSRRRCTLSGWAPFVEYPSILVVVARGVSDLSVAFFASLTDAAR